MNKKTNTMIILLFTLVSFLAGRWAGNDYLLSVLILIAINVLMACSLRTIFILEQISLGHVGFALIGAYSSALMVMKLNISFWLALPLSGSICALTALLLGYPFLRLKGIYFAILTFMLAESLRLIAYNWRSLTGGQFGLTDIPGPGTIGLPFLGTIDFDTMENYYYLTLMVVILSILVLFFIEKSHLNVKWRAIKDAESLAQSVGMNAILHRIMNFVIASFFAGIGGALFAHYQKGLSVEVTSRFGIMASIYLLVYVVIGGKEKFSGPIVGTIVLMMISEFARSFEEYRPIIIGFIAIIVVLFLPEGVTGIPERLTRLKQQLKKG
ncbi:branched-chain amino acid ABC transporter permease [Desulfobacula sp.]|uniref:branched-chain amino acid ABC transporter permease n=1 Tax=Desulfobacula sp. TaxID=2593537 RepID=UPI00263A1B63|nr:branched-chain amino acid ABC transporter permease [Desulfobacula sp.]